MTFLRNSDSSLMKMYNASKPGQEKSEKRRRKNRLVRVKVKMKRMRSFTTPKTCPWAGMAKSVPCFPHFPTFQPEADANLGKLMLFLIWFLLAHSLLAV